MHDTIGHALSVFMGFFAIMNPIANTPIFLGLTAGDSPDVRKRVALKAVMTAFLIIVVFCLLGKLIFELFGITLPAFRITGGVLVALIGYNMLHGEQSKVHQTGDDQQSNLEAALSVAVTPLAIPILSGPGTIATAMNFASTGGIGRLIVTIVAFALLCLITYGFFISGQRLVAFLGENGLGVITRIMGLILAVIGVQMLIDGIAGAIHAG
ncbi:MAG: MarC family protein [Gammaproteobacteria bacterium]|nr:MarC family protein [Gammaproteobacteria bacterium]